MPLTNSRALLVDTSSKLNRGEEGIERTLKFMERAIHTLCSAHSDLYFNCVSLLTRTCYLHITSVKWAEESRMFWIFYNLKAKMSIVVWMSTSMMTQHLDLIQERKMKNRGLCGFINSYTL